MDLLLKSIGAKPQNINNVLTEKKDNISELLLDKATLRKMNKLKISDRHFEFISRSTEVLELKKYFEISKDEIINKLKVNEGQIEIIDNLIIEEKNGIYLGKLERLNIDGIEVDEKIYEKYYNNSGAKEFFGKFTLESNLSKDHPYFISNESFKILEYTDSSIEDLNNFRKKSTQKEWMDLVLKTLGYDPNELLFWEKIFILVRLITFCEKSFHIMELGKRGVGKNYLYELFKPESTVITGTATIANLYYNENSNEDGSIIKHNVVVLNEIGDITFKEDIIPTLQTYMSGEEVKKGRLIPQGTSIVFMGNIDNPEMKMEFQENLLSGLNKRFNKSALLDRFCYFIPNWGMREMKEAFYVKPSQKGLPLDYFSKILKKLRNKDFTDLITERICSIAPKASTRDINAISKTVSGLIKILHLGDTPNEDELLAYLAIAMKSRHLLNQQMVIANKENYENKGLSPESNKTVSKSLVNFIAHIEDISIYDDLISIPNRLVSDSGEWLHFHALDALGLEKNKKSEPHAASYKDISKAKQWVFNPNTVNHTHNYSSYFPMYFNNLQTFNYFIDRDVEYYDNLFGERFLESNHPLHNQYFSNQCNVYLDDSVGYPYKKTVPNQIECSCGEKATLINSYYYYDENSLQVPLKEVKKQFLKLGII